MTRLHPLTSLALTFQAAVLVLLAERTESLVALAAVSAAYALAGGAWRRWRWIALLIATGTWSMMLSQGLFYALEPRTALLEIPLPAWFPAPYGGGTPALRLYVEGMVYGLVQSLRMDSIVLLAAGVLARHSADQLASGLRAAGAPAGLSFLGAMALRHIPVLVQESRDLWRAQRLRGMPLLPGRNGGVSAFARQLLLPLLAGNLRRADEIAAALHARGFTPDAMADLPVEPVPTRRRRLLWCGAVAVGAAVALVQVAKFQQAGVLDWPALKGLAAWVAAHV